MIERGDHVVLSEPFSRAYYDGPEQRSQRFPVTAPDATVGAVADDITRDARSSPTFVKDMAYHVATSVKPTMLARFTNTFLIRDPAGSIPSFARHWPDFTDEELGFDAVASLVAIVESLGQPVVVIDNDDLRRDPHGIVAAWCAATGIAFDETALAWEPGEQSGWERWSDWHETTAGSSGFLPPEPAVPPHPADPAVAAAIERARPVYERLRARRLGAGEA